MSHPRPKKVISKAPPESSSYFTRPISQLCLPLFPGLKDTGADGIETLVEPTD